MVGEVLQTGGKVSVADRTAKSLQLRLAARHVARCPFAASCLFPLFKKEPNLAVIFAAAHLNHSLWEFHVDACALGGRGRHRATEWLSVALHVHRLAMVQSPAVGERAPCTS
jgi:hypothetical protein